MHIVIFYSIINAVFLKNTNMQKQPKKRAISKRSKLYKTTSRWKLSHRIHTGRLLPHAHTSYPALAMIVLCVGVLMGGLSQVSNAAPPNDIVVSARLPGPAPTMAATIDSPADGARFTAKPIIVSGSCPTNTYVELIRNGVTSGVAICQADLTYSLSTDLFSGANSLQAQVYNTTDVPGPISSTVTVYYDPPIPLTSGQPKTSQPPAPSGSTSTPPRPSGSTPAAPVPPLLLQTNFSFTGHYVGDPASFQFSVNGGQSPYAINVDWGDGTTKLITIEKSGTFTVDHVYEKAGGYANSYTIKISAADVDGNETLLQIITQVTDKPTAQGIGKTGESGGLGLLPKFDGELITRLIWSAYTMVLLMVLSFWLGERHELRILKGRFGRSHRA